MLVFKRRRTWFLGRLGPTFLKKNLARQLILCTRLQFSIAVAKGYLVFLHLVSTHLQHECIFYLPMPYLADDI